MNKIEIKRLNIAINYFTDRYFEVYKKPVTFDKVQKFLFFVDLINNLNKLSYDKTLKDGSIINFANEIEDEYLKEVFEGYKTIKELGRCR